MISALWVIWSMQKPGCRMCILALAAFTFLTAALPVSWRKKKLARTNCILVFFSSSALPCERWRMKKLGCTICILVFFSFSSLISALKGEKARMHIVHLSVFIFHLSPHTSHSVSRQELRWCDFGCTLCFPGFFILLLIESAEISELKFEKARMHNVVRWVEMSRDENYIPKFR